MKQNLILMGDSYKMSHQTENVYPAGAINLHSYGEARISPDKDVVMLGVQGFIRTYLSSPITVDDFYEAKEVCELHGVPFNTALWMRVISQYNGFLPLMIHALPEGSVVKGGTPMYTVQLAVDDPLLISLPSFIETALQRAVWYPTTVATQDRQLYKYLEQAYEWAADTKDMLPFAYHDFGARGVSSEESAMIGGMAHMVYFSGSDNMAALRYVRKYYPSLVDDTSYMPAYSVPATEHSIQCSFGASGIEQKQYIVNTIRTLGKKGGIVSVVLDGFNFWRELDTVCSQDIKDEIAKVGCKFVVRPDSGDPEDMLPLILEKLEDSFGVTINTKGFKVLNGVGILWGDGIDQHKAMYLTSKCVLELGYSPENVIFGSGGALLQKLNRDTLRFAQKASAIKMPNGEWVGVSKKPVTDSGKTSKHGLQTTPEMYRVYDCYPVDWMYESFEQIRFRAKAH